MSIHDAAQALVETLPDNLRLHISTDPKLEPNFKEMFEKCREGDEDKIPLKEVWESIGKPWGLWYSFGGSWMDWCLSESEGWLRPYIYEVLVDETKALRITNLEEFAAFEKEYYYVPRRFQMIEDMMPPLPPILRHSEFYDGRSLFGNINWMAVREKYGAVEITPYLYERRLNSRWYYGWDCASGCVWETGYKGVRLFAVYDERKDAFVRTT
jgi:hypothetical protein